MRAGTRHGFDEGRRALLAKIHLLAKQSGLDEDGYRDLLERETGKRSAAVLSLSELTKVCDALLRTPASTRVQGPFAGKLKALWISGWHLGIVRDRSDDAMLAFVERQTGLQSTRFLINAADANKAVEGLKSWLERQAGVRWWEQPDNPRRAVVEAQVRRLEQLGDIRDFDNGRATFLEDYVCRVTGRNRGLHYCNDQDWDRAIAALGARLRRAERRTTEGKHNATERS